MDVLKRYDALLSRLLFDRPFRSRVRAGDLSELGAEADAFSVVDFDTCETFATAIRDGLINGNLGGLGIGRAFPGTIDALGAGAAGTVERFLEAHRETRAFDGTCRQAGVSVFESFFHWADPQLAGRPGDRCRAQHELSRALLEVLARKPNPGFTIEWPLARPFSRGWFCVLDAHRPMEDPRDRPEVPVAYVAALGQFVTGEDALDFAAVALERDAPLPPWERERVSRLDAATLAALTKIYSGAELT
jgi:hypothetical protein